MKVEKETQAGPSSQAAHWDRTATWPIVFCWACHALFRDIGDIACHVCGHQMFRPIFLLCTQKCLHGKMKLYKHATQLASNKFLSYSYQVSYTPSLHTRAPSSGVVSSRHTTSLISPARGIETCDLVWGLSEEKLATQRAGCGRMTWS